MKTKRPDPDRSTHLNDQENYQLIEFIKSTNGVPIATAIVQLYLSQKPNHQKWYKFQTGIICFIKDYAKKSYFFRLFNSNNAQLWEQEMYTPFSYNRLTSNFHYFAADESNAGFNFAFNDEANKFYDIMTKKIEAKAPKNENVGSVSKGIPQVQDKKPSSMPSTGSSGKLGGLIGNSKNDKKKKINVSKIDISGPTNFKHVNHFGISGTNNNFQTMDDNDEMAVAVRVYLSKLNIPVNKKTQEFVYHFIIENGGLKKFNEDLKKQGIISSQNSNQMEVPAVPPPLVANPYRQQPKTTAPPNLVPPPPPSHPPPPPPSNFEPPNRLPAPVPDMTARNNSNKSFPTPPPPPPPPLHPPPPSMLLESNTQVQQNPVSSNGCLLNAIENFSLTKLKPVSQDAQVKQPIEASGNQEISLVDQLLGALREREQHLRESSDGSSGDSDSDWN